MTPSQWQLVNHLFDEAIDADVDSFKEQSWSTFLAQQHIADERVASKARALVKAHQSEGQSFLVEPAMHIPQQIVDVISGKNTDLKPGATVQDFCIEKLLGKGTFASVYLARQTSLDRLVALKITDNISGEARLMADLEHEYIVPVYSETIDTNALGSRRLICMQHVAGLTLQDLLAQLYLQPRSSLNGQTIVTIIDAHADSNSTLFDPAALRSRTTIATSSYESACLWIVARLAEALDFAHTRQVLHLDIKPANILIDQYGRPKLTDFNVSKSLNPKTSGEQQLGGTAAYMSPEHVCAFKTNQYDLITLQCDMYSLAIVLAEMLNGSLPDSRVEIVEQIEAWHLPRQLKDILHKALAKDQSARFKSGSEFASCLEQARWLEGIEKRMPAKTWGDGWIKYSPFWVLFCFILLPNLVGGVVQILYNFVLIGSELSAAQQQVFVWSLLPYNLAAFFTADRLMARRFRALQIIYPEYKKGLAVKHADINWLRRDILNMPYTLIFATAVGWLPGAIIFPALIDLWAGPIALYVYGHFVTSFVMSWLIALTFSFLLMDYFIIVGFYQILWSASAGPTGNASVELHPVKQRHHLLQILAGVVPLSTAILLVLFVTQSLAPEQFFIYRILVIGMIIIGIGGFVFALKTTDRVKAVMDAFVGAV